MSFYSASSSNLSSRIEKLLDEYDETEKSISYMKKSIQDLIEKYATFDVEKEMKRDTRYASHPLVHRKKKSSKKSKSSRYSSDEELSSSERRQLDLDEAEYFDEFIQIIDQQKEQLAELEIRSSEIYHELQIIKYDYDSNIVLSSPISERFEKIFS